MELKPEQTILKKNRIEYEIINTNWKPLLQKLSIENNKSIFENIIETQKEKYKNSKIYPKQEQIFRCFNYFNIEETRVVIIGQDPYHGPNQANGLCFSVNPDEKIPPSLRNIYKVLKYKTDLEKWAKQGVLMLNTSLSVVEKNPGSHLKYWLLFTKQILEHINNHCKNVVFVCWGAFAFNLIENIQVKTQINNHKVLISSHPSPLSCRRGLKSFPSFLSSDVFNKVNELLENPIVW